MKERPILMTPENAQKCFEGVKTQTRRIINPQPPGRIFEKYGCWNSANFEGEWVCKFGEVGDRLWIREPMYRRDDVMTFVDGSEVTQDELVMPAWGEKKTIPSIHMPRWACRTVVEITGIRVQRLQEISYDDEGAEGIVLGPDCNDRHSGFIALWESINGPGSWEENLFVWALTFKKV